MITVPLFIIGLFGIPSTLATMNDWVEQYFYAIRLISIVLALLILYFAFEDKIRLPKPVRSLFGMAPEKEESATPTLVVEYPDTVSRKEHEALEERVKGIETKVDSLVSSEQREVVVRKLSEQSPAGEITVASDMTVIDHAVEIRSILEEAGLNVTVSYLDEGEAPDGITVSGSASGLVLDAFKQVDLDMKEDPTKKTGPTYIVVGFMKDKKKNK